MDSWGWHRNVRGLTLNFDFLRTKGVSSQFLSEWEYGCPLEGDSVVPRFHRNHSSMSQHAEWAEQEWSRLEALGKVRFFP